MAFMDVVIELAVQTDRVMLLKEEHMMRTIS